MTESVPKKEITQKCEFRCWSIYGCPLYPYHIDGLARFNLEDCWKYRVELLD